MNFMKGPPNCTKHDVSSIATRKYTMSKKATWKNEIYIVESLNLFN